MWKRFWDTFHGSEVIFWSRFNIALMSAWCALQGVDVSPFLHEPKYIAYWAIFSNFVNELLRRNRAQYDEDGRMR